MGKPARSPNQGLSKKKFKDSTATKNKISKEDSPDVNSSEVSELGNLAESVHNELGHWVWYLALILSCIKALLIPTYRSTDFEVHRNWLAITHSLPLKDWYYESTSSWTLDYPPFFAYFEFFLSQFAALVDPDMVLLKNLNHASVATITFQRMSVILSDFVLVYACKDFCQTRFSQLLSRSRGEESSAIHRLTSIKNLTTIVSFLLLGNFGLFLVDHIHFQYNGFLFGIFLLSICRIYQRRHVEAALIFATLLNFKHIFVYVAPAYFVYLLKICFLQYDGKGRVVCKTFSPLKLIVFGVTVIGVFLMSFGPFFHQVPQVLTRLFPFKRGLCHAYWAPNFWALYNVADKILLVLSKIFDIPLQHVQGSMTGGLVQQFDHAVLLPIKPPVAFVLTFFTMLPALFNLWNTYPTPMRFVRVVTLCAFSSYLFGWHVHEKAILLVIIPFTLLSFDTFTDKKLFFLLSSTGHFSLFPLLFTPAEAPIKVLLYLVYTLLSYQFLSSNVIPASSSDKPLLNKLERLYVFGFVAIQIYVGVGHRLLGWDLVLPFIPLMLMSCYCAFGVMYVWVKFYFHTLKLPI